MRKLIPLFLIFFTTACAVGPNYRRPKVDVPGGYRGVAEPNAAQPPLDPSQQSRKLHSKPRSLLSNLWETRNGWRYFRIRSSRT